MHRQPGQQDGRHESLHFIPSGFMDAVRTSIVTEGLFIYSRPRLCPPEYRKTEIAPHEQFLSVVAQPDPTFVNGAGFRIQNVSAIIFRTVLPQAAHDDHSDYRRALPVIRTFFAAFL